MVNFEHNGALSSLFCPQLSILHRNVGQNVRDNKEILYEIAAEFFYESRAHEDCPDERDPENGWQVASIT